MHFLTKSFVTLLPVHVSFINVFEMNHLFREIRSRLHSKKKSQKNLIWIIVQVQKSV